MSASYYRIDGISISAMGEQFPWSGMAGETNDRLYEIRTYATGTVYLVDSRCVPQLPNTHTTRELIRRYL